MTYSTANSIGQVRNREEQLAQLAKPETLALSLDVLFAEREERDQHQRADAAGSMQQVEIAGPETESASVHAV